MAARQPGPGSLGEGRARPGHLLRETEAGFQGWVIDAAHQAGWLVAHFRPAHTERGWRTPVEADGAGWPDLALCKPPTLLLAELKSERGRLSLEQADWLNRLAGCDRLESGLWRPCDRPEIQERLFR